MLYRVDKAVLIDERMGACLPRLPAVGCERAVGFLEHSLKITAVQVSVD